MWIPRRSKGRLQGTRTLPKGPGFEKRVSLVRVIERKSDGMYCHTYLYSFIVYAETMG